MELSRIFTARSVWLFDVAELNPRGLRVEPIFDALKARYQFAEVAPDEKKNGLVFKNGTFLASGEPIMIDTLEVYDDGIVVNTHSSTVISDAVIEDSLNWLFQEYKLGGADFKQRVRRLYISEVSFLCPGVSIGRGVGSFLSLTELVGKASGQSQVEIQSVVFGSSEKRTLFTFERRIGEPFAMNKYFSTGAMPTPVHLDLLEAACSLLSNVNQLGMG
ncbi:MAG: hypothetical protein C5B51_14945 [Terriglobia bacterium]|nr:MAG: hypothetical protein C5B51_14945 [Terriglobia bacterium]